MRKIKQVLCIMLAGGFLTFLYPSLLTIDDVVTVQEEGEEDNLYLALLRAKPEEIQFRSRIWELWQKIRHADKRTQ